MIKNKSELGGTLQPLRTTLEVTNTILKIYVRIFHFQSKNEDHKKPHCSWKMYIPVGWNHNKLSFWKNLETLSFYRNLPWPNRARQLSLEIKEKPILINLNIEQKGNEFCEEQKKHTHPLISKLKKSKDDEKKEWILKKLM